MKKFFKRSIFLLIFLMAMIPAAAQAKRAQAVKSPQALRIDGELTKVRGYNIGSYNHYRLRDLARALQGKVDFDLAGNSKQITIDCTKTYTPIPGDQIGGARERALGRQMQLTVIGAHPAELVETAYNIKDFNYFLSLIHI